MLRVIQPVPDSCKLIRLLRRRDIDLCLLDFRCVLCRSTAEGHEILIPVVHDDPIITFDGCVAPKLNWPSSNFMTIHSIT